MLYKLFAHQLVRGVKMSFKDAFNKTAVKVILPIALTTMVATRAFSQDKPSSDTLGKQTEQVSAQKSDESVAKPVKGIMPGDIVIFQNKTQEKGAAAKYTCAQMTGESVESLKKIDWDGTDLELFKMVPGTTTVAATLKDGSVERGTFVRMLDPKNIVLAGKSGNFVVSIDDAVSISVKHGG